MFLVFHSHSFAYQNFSLRSLPFSGDFPDFRCPKEYALSLSLFKVDKNQFSKGILLFYAARKYDLRVSMTASSFSISIAVQYLNFFVLLLSAAYGTIQFQNVWSTTVHYLRTPGHFIKYTFEANFIVWRRSTQKRKFGHLHPRSLCFLVLTFLGFLPEHRGNLIVQTKKKWTISSKKCGFSSLKIGQSGKLRLGKLGQFGPRSPRCPSFQPGPKISLLCFFPSFKG